MIRNLLLQGIILFIIGGWLTISHLPPPNTAVSENIVFILSAIPTAAGTALIYVALTHSKTP